MWGLLQPRPTQNNRADGWEEVQDWAVLREQGQSMLKTGSPGKPKFGQQNKDKERNYRQTRLD